MWIVFQEEVGPIPRYILFTFAGYWTGEDWSPEKRHALLYHDLDSAMAAADRLEGFREPQQFWTHVIITIQEDDDFDVQEIREYLRRNCRIKVRHGKGESPCSEVLFDIEIDWESLERL